MSADRVEHVARLVEQLNAEIASDAEKSRADDEKLAAAARRGDNGPEWRRIQERIDLGQTTLADVFTGSDSSTDATILVARSQQSLSTLSDELADAAENDPEAFDPTAEAEELAAEMQRRVAAVQRLIGGIS